ncbi:MAG: bifunctional transaldolase/phosoglucose isomerase [Thermoleophilaceae bacterium]|nr:bifunctional transaldolase/phosoglucose isomerase [Thermoleophilaceae bacterium]
MSVTQRANERLAALTAAGVSVWLDQIRRSLIESGELERMVREESLRGVTANPAIFEKAILGSPDYDEDLAELAREDLDAFGIYERLAIRDVQLAADVLRPVWEASGGADGFVSLEVAPSLARDTEGTLAQVRDYWRRVDRPNLMIKIPGTEEGVPAIEQATFEGINVNVTLLFAVGMYEQAAEAYIRGLERRRAAGESVSDVHSVASFFVSRVDAEVDKRLEALGRTDLCGIAALANARLAYQRFKEMFYGERFSDLRAEGAAVQRPLWASTGVKSPRYPETKYVDGLIAPDTVNTMPMQTLHAYAERGQVPGPTADQPADKTRRQLDALAEAGIDLDEVTDKLLRDGIVLFEEALAKLLDGIDRRRAAVATGRPEAIEAHLPRELEGPVRERVRRAAEEDVARRIWRKDESLWGGPGRPEIGNRLGWLTITEPMLEEAGSILEFAAQAAADGLTDAVLVGMGGSSLAPEVIRRSFGPRERALRLHVLDTTDATQIRALEGSIDIRDTLFVVSTKSGGTIETLSLASYFLARVREEGGDPRRQLVAITDPGSGLVGFAQRNGFRHVFLADPDIGGRYSALSHFGLVPAALAGVDIRALLERAQVAEQRCAEWDRTETNSGLWLGLVLGECALRGRDKLTFLVDDTVAAFGLWVEQLVAESTGKEGRGIVPIVDEPLGDPGAYGDDRVFVQLRNPRSPDRAADELIAALGAAGHPTITVPVEGPEDLGSLFFFAELGTAVAGWVLGINPFDQPNVQEAKDNTRKVLDRYAREGSLPRHADASDEALRALLAQAEPGRYVALMGYLAVSAEVDREVAELRRLLRDRTRAATTFGYGPRFLHSTGQLHKGGPPSGLFLQLVHDGPEDIEIPDAGYGFDTLKNAQAAGDLETLRAHGLTAERVTLSGDPAQAIRGLRERIGRLL